MPKIDLHARLKSEITSVDQAMRDDLQALVSKDLIPSNLLEVLEHALYNGGKRIRPLLCILTSRLCSTGKKEISPLAIAFEYLHVATLLHDDVIDHADTRRGRPAANKVFGLTPAILAGDFLHARSMFLVGTLGGKRCLDLICSATGAMVAGEFLQISNVHNLNQSEKDYFSVINGKTALFIGAACETGGIFAGADNNKIEALKLYGANLGLAFQIQDDILDYLGDSAKTGKTVGNDFYEGKMTLPLIHALETANKQENNFLLDLLKGQKSERITKIDDAREIIRKNGGFEYAEQLAEKLVDNGIASLAVFASDQNRETLGILTGLAHYAISRDK
ncbi:MAG: polyprenyl synthetase family protein [Desulfobulbaceae bacterium]|nr:polyprenyl synthetase family protein [Desulfobulbaceae bacterium]